MAIEVAITDHRPLLLELKAATKARTQGPEGLGNRIESDPYMVGSIAVRYALTWTCRGRHVGWEGRWMLGDRKVGENHLFHELRKLEGV